MPPRAAVANLDTRLAHLEEVLQQVLQRLDALECWWAAVDKWLRELWNSRARLRAWMHPDEENCAHARIYIDV